MSTFKGPSPTKHDGEPLRIAIVHARWNSKIIDSLVAGAIAKLKEAGVKESNIVVESVPGSFELPLACSKVIAGSHVQAGSGAVTDLLGGLSMIPSRSSTPAPPVGAPKQPIDAVIAIGCLIKGETMHFEYIAESVAHALMKVQLETGVPVIFGVLTVLQEEQALERAGLKAVTMTTEKPMMTHNHGEDWGLAAVEMGSHSRRWTQGKLN